MEQNRFVKTALTEIISRYFLKQLRKSLRMVQLCRSWLTFIRLKNSRSQVISLTFNVFSLFSCHIVHV